MHFFLPDILRRMPTRCAHAGQKDTLLARKSAYRIEIDASRRAT
jgi:hypothetical protein